MQLTSIGLSGYQTARAGLESAATRIVSDASDIDAVIDLETAEQQAKLALELIKRGDEISDSLLDILA